jgi:hypothetical protein
VNSASGTIGCSPPRRRRRPVPFPRVRTSVIGPAPPPTETERYRRGGQARGGHADVPPHGRQVAGGDHRVGRQAVHLGLVEQQEKRPAAADAVRRVVQVQLRVLLARRVQVLDPQPGPFAQLVKRAELDGLGRAGLGAGRLHAGAEPVVAQRALVCLAVLLAPGDHAERAGPDAVTAAVADVVLDHHGAELGAEQRPGRAHVQAGRLGAVLAHVAGHQPADALCGRQGGRGRSVRWEGRDK